MENIKRINHVAIAVEDMETALVFWRDYLGIPLSHIESVPDQQARVAFLPVGESEIELVEPSSVASGTAKFIHDRGPGMHHICLEVEELDVILEKLQKCDVRLINEKPVEMKDRRLAFIHPKSTGGVLVELYELN